MSGFQAKILLLAVFIARGTSFLFSKQLMQTMGPENVLAIRFTISFLVLAVFFRRKLQTCTRSSLKGGIILGLLYSLCMFFEMHGLRTVDTGVSSFIENMAIVLVPLYVACYTRRLPQKEPMFCCMLALMGVWLLSRSQMTGGANRGILLVILAAATYGICILATESVSSAPEADPLTIGIIQLGVMGLLNVFASLPSGTLRLPRGVREWAMILMLALVCSSFGFAFQPVGQRYVSAQTAAVFTVVNPLTTSILGVAVAGESLGVGKVAGYLLILTALYFYNRLPDRVSS